MNNPLSITELANLIKKHLPKEKILLTSECGFGHVPIDIVKNKIKMLVATAKKL